MLIFSDRQNTRLENYIEKGEISDSLQMTLWDNTGHGTQIELSFSFNYEAHCYQPTEIKKIVDHQYVFTKEYYPDGTLLFKKINADQAKSGGTFSTDEKIYYIQNLEDGNPLVGHIEYDFNYDHPDTLKPVREVNTAIYNGHDKPLLIQCRVFEQGCNGVVIVSEDVKNLSAEEHRKLTNYLISLNLDLDEQHTIIPLPQVLLDRFVERMQTQRYNNQDVYQDNSYNLIKDLANGTIETWDFSKKYAEFMYQQKETFLAWRAQQALKPHIPSYYEMGVSEDIEGMVAEGKIPQNIAGTVQSIFDSIGKHVEEAVKEQLEKMNTVNFFSPERMNIYENNVLRFFAPKNNQVCNEENVCIDAFRSFEYTLL